MKAVLCKQHGMPDTLVVEEVEAPAIKAGHVRVRVHACGVNFPDTLIIQGKYQFQPDLPFSPGGEVAGEIVEVAEDVKDLQVGTRVLGMTGWGGFAEEVVVSAANVIAIPDAMDYVTASGFLMTYATSYYALKQRGQLKPGETLVVLGAAGGVGLAAVELGAVMGARVIAAASSEEKLALAKQYGAEQGIDYSKENLKTRIKELTGGQGADVIYDPVGGDYFEQAVRSIAWQGRALVIGFAAGEIPKFPINLALLKGCQIVGVFWGAFNGREPLESQQNNRELLEMYGQGKLKPHVCQTFSMDQAGEALYTLMNRRAQGKVVITI